MCQRMEQDRRRQVVRQVADQSQLSGARQRGEIDTQHIGCDQRQHAVRGCGECKRLQQVAVELDRGQGADAVEQRQCQRTLAGSDLDDLVAGLRIDGEHDLLDHRTVVQEVLAEAFLRLPGKSSRVVQRWPAHLARRRVMAMRVQALIAAYRLDGSAMPRPAMSNAVPWSTATRG
jgi:hypothetical protein